MKAVKVRELFGTIPDWGYKGEERVLRYDNELYMPLKVADDAGYIIRDAWVEEIDYEIV